MFARWFIQQTLITIHSKLGFRTSAWMIYIFYRVNEIFNETWIPNLQKETSKSACKQKFR